VQVELVTLLGIFAAACAVNQISHLILEGSLFAGLRRWAEQKEFVREGPGVKGIALREKRGLFSSYIRGLFDCRLCFAQEVAVVVTWVTLALAYSVDPGLTSWQGWAGAAVFGPFIVGGVDWILNACREN
jgi:hypothetical protein